MNAKQRLTRWLSATLVVALLATLLPGLAIAQDNNRPLASSDEFRANDEILARFFPDGVLDRETVLRAAPGGDQDIRFLIAPSRERAALLNKAYMALVKEQGFAFGRDAVIKPTVNVHSVIANGDTALRQSGRIYTDGVLWLDWRGYQPRQ